MNSLLRFSQLGQSVVLHRVRLVFHSIQLLTVGHMGLLGDDGRGVRSQGAAERARAVGGRFKVLGATGAVLHIIHGRSWCRSVRSARNTRVRFSTIFAVFSFHAKCVPNFF
jgi:hypothetical protein